MDFDITLIHLCVSQVREIKHKRFAMFHSGNEFPIREMKNDLGLTNFECTRDSHGNNFTFFETSALKRVNQILHAFQKFNQDYPSKAIQIEGGLGLDPPIVTFNIHDNYQQHHIYLKIQAAKQAKQSGQDVNYMIWTLKMEKQIDDVEYPRDGLSKSYSMKVLISGP